MDGTWATEAACHAEIVDPTPSADADRGRFGRTMAVERLADGDLRFENANGQARIRSTVPQR